MLNKKKWIPSNEIILEPSAENAIKCEKSSVVLAGPGAGKTELLAQKASYLLQTEICKPPQKILAISFKVDAAENLKKRVELRCEKELSRRFESKTFDSFAKLILDKFRLALPEIYRPKKDYNIILETKEFKEIILGFLTERNPIRPNWVHEVRFDTLFKMITSQPLPLSNIDEDSDNWIIRNVWKLLIHGKNTLPSSLTFPMISRLAEYILKTNPLIKNALQLTYSHIFLDEFQDTTYQQYELICTAFRSSSNILTAVGDDKQRIMGWAGAMHNSFEKFITDFEARKFELTKNHRSAPKLVEMQNIIASMMRDNSVIVQSAENKYDSEGECQLWNFSHYEDEAKHISINIEEKINKQKLTPRDICILVKQHDHIYAKAIMRELEKQGINSRLEKEYQDIIEEECVVLIIDIIKLACYNKAPRSWTNVIDALIYLNGYETEENLVQLMEVEVNLKQFINSIKDDLEFIFLEELKLKKFTRELIDKIINFIGIDKLKGSFPKYARGNFLNSILDKLTKKLTDSNMKRSNWKDTIKDFLGEFSIPIMTIHKSKGLEYHTVFFVGLEDSAFWSFKSQQEADLCAFFVAFSRAKQEVYFTFSKIREILYYQELKEVEQYTTNISTLYQMLSDANVEILDFS
ncbi:putative ATP-dependent DNA helicase YjcD [compost metagenome]